MITTMMMNAMNSTPKILKNDGSFACDDASGSIIKVIGTEVDLCPESVAVAMRL